MPKVEINGSVVEFDHMPTTEDIDHAAGVLKGQGAAAPLADVQGSLQTPAAAAAGRGVTRTVAQGLGGLAGGAAGIPGGPAAIATGALGGAGLGGTAVDVLSGQADPMRLAAQTAGYAVSGPLSAGLGTAKAIASTGLATAISGSLYDLAHGLVSGQWKAPPEVLKQGLTDIAAGAIGEGIGRAGEGARVSRETSRTEALGAQSLRRRQFEEAGVTPRASELTGSRLVGNLETQAERAPIGGGRSVALEKTRRGQLSSGIAGDVEKISPESVPTMEHAGNIVGGALQQAKAQWEADEHQAFQAVNAITGDQPVVPTTKLRQVATEVLALGRQKPFGAPAGTAKLATSAEGPTILDSTGKPIASRSTTAEPTAFAGDTVDQPLETMLGQALQQEKIPLWLAQRIKSEVGAVAFRDKAPVGRIQSADAKALYRAIRQDYDTFFDTEVGQSVEPSLQQANEFYRRGRTTYNNTIARNFLMEKSDPVKALQSAFSPGNITAMRDLEQSLPPDVWNQAVKGAIKGLYDKANVPVGEGFVFNRGVFAKGIQDWDRSGQLDLMLGPERAEHFRSVAAVARAMREPSSAGHRESVAQTFVAPAGILHAAATGHPELALGEATAAYGLPMGLGQLVARPGGIKALTRMATPSMPASAPASLGAGQGLGTNVMDTLGRLLMPWWQGTPQQNQGQK